MILAVCSMSVWGCAPKEADAPAASSARVESLRTMGDVHLREGRFRAAMQSYMEAEGLEPNNAELKFRIALVYADYFNRLEDAVRYYQEAIRLKKDYSEAYNNLGTVYMRQRRWDDAIAMFQKALENLYYATPEMAYYNLARAYEEKGEDSRAIEFYEMAIELKKHYLDPYGRLGLLYQKQGQYGPALRVFQQLRAQLEKQEPKTGKATQEELREYRSSLAGAYYHQGICLHRLGRVAEARESFERALGLAPDAETQRVLERALGSLPPR
jgi:type IV pilus assembly protein PilF